MFFCFFFFVSVFFSFIPSFSFGWFGLFVCFVGLFFWLVFFFVYFFLVFLTLTVLFFLPDVRTYCLCIYVRNPFSNIFFEIFFLKYIFSLCCRCRMLGHFFFHIFQLILSAFRPLACTRARATKEGINAASL